MSTSFIWTSPGGAADAAPAAVDSCAQSEPVQLSDGRSVAIRPIVPVDLDALRTFFAALSPKTRRLRFHVSMNELPEYLLRHFTMIDARRHLAFVAEAHGAAVNDPATLVAEARCVRHADSDSAEFALVVADDWRRVGLGGSLVATLVRNARLAGVRRLCGDVLLENEDVVGFMHSLGALSLARSGSAETVRLCLDV